MSDELMFLIIVCGGFCGLLVGLELIVRFASWVEYKTVIEPFRKKYGFTCNEYKRHSLSVLRKG